MQKNLISLIILGVLAVVFYFIFGVYIVQSEGNINNMVEGYEAGYSDSDTAQAKGFDLIKSNWNRVWGDKNLMQKQVDKTEIDSE